MSDPLRETLARARELSLRVGKHQQIRVHHWVRALLAQPTSNATWMRNVLEYANALLQMLESGELHAPFDKLPPQGPLPTLPRDTVHSAVRAPLSRLASHAASSHKYRDPASNQSETTPLKRVRNQQVQTREGEEQWEWVRVWKGAFEQMRGDLKAKSKQIRALEIELKELRAVLGGTEKALEQQVCAREEIRERHDAELRNTRAVHELELQAIKLEHRKKLQDVMVQNDRELQRRKMRDSSLSESYGDFLDYIDAFHMQTLALTQNERQA